MRRIFITGIFSWVYNLGAAYLLDHGNLAPAMTEFVKNSAGSTIIVSIATAVVVGLKALN